MTRTYSDAIALQAIIKSRHPSEKVNISVSLTYDGRYRVFGKIGKRGFGIFFTPEEFYIASVDKVADFIEPLISKQLELFIMNIEEENNERSSSEVDA